MPDRSGFMVGGCSGSYVLDEKLILDVLEFALELLRADFEAELVVSSGFDCITSFEECFRVEIVHDLMRRKIAVIPQL